MQLLALLGKEGKTVVEARHIAVLADVTPSIVSRLRNSARLSRLEPFVKIADALGYDIVLGGTVMESGALVGQLRQRASEWQVAGGRNLSDLAHAADISVFTVYEWIHRPQGKPVRLLSPIVAVLRVIGLGLSFTERK